MRIRAIGARPWVAVALALLVAGLAGCDWIKGPTGPSTTQQQNVTVVIGPTPAPTATPAPPNCEVTAVSVSAELPGQRGITSFTLAQVPRLDATPRNGKGALHDQGCPVLPIVWSPPAGTATCRLAG